MRLLLFLSLFLTLPSLASASEGPSVFLLTDCNGYVHDVVKPTGGESLVKRTLEHVVSENLGGKLVHSDDASKLTDGVLDPANTQALVMYTTGELPLDLDLLNRYVEAGGTLMGIHCATDTFHDDPRFHNLLGGTFLEHPWFAAADVVLKATDEAHPAVAPIGPSRALKEEIYLHKNFEATKVRVLMVLDMEKTHMKRPQVVPIVWVKQVGKGRVLYTSLGHNEAVWESDWYQQHLTSSLKWLLGELEGSAEPNPQVTEREERVAAAAHIEAEVEALGDRFAAENVTPPSATRPATKTAANGAEAADEEGFVALFDGTAESAHARWRGFKKDDLPPGWAVEDGALTLKDKDQGDIVTRERYADFELRLEWKIAAGGNSGIMYRVSETGEGTDATYLTGPEYQLLDDEAAADNKTTMTRAGALYGLVPAPERSPVKPAGEWNEARIIVKGNHIEHWLNGVKTAEVEIGSDDWNQRLAASKFAKWPRFAKEAEGHIALQDHGDEIAFRNIRIKRLEDEGGRSAAGAGGKPTTRPRG